MSIRIRDLRSRAQRTGGTMYDRLFTRRLSVFVTAALLPLGVSPNAVSLFNIIIGVAAWTLIALNVYPLVGVLLIHIYAVLDSVDGELARASGKSSLKGLFLEDYSAYLMINGYWVAMGAYLAGFYHEYGLLAGGFAVAAFGRLAMPAVRRALLKTLEKTGPPVEESAYPATNRFVAPPRGLARFLFVDVLHPSSVWALSTTVLAVEYVVGGGHIGLSIAVAVYLALSVAREVAVIFRALTTDSLNRQLLEIVDQARFGDMSDDRRATNHGQAR